VGTADREGHVNVSPKGMESLHVFNPNLLVWLNLTGSGNETAAHVVYQPRMTLMFCAFEGKPLILRIYGQAKTIHPRDPEWSQWIHMFPNLPGARQIFLVEIDLVQTSCGFGVPNLKYMGDREELFDWAENMGEAGVQEYWKKNNQTSLNEKPTKIFQ